MKPKDEFTQWCEQALGSIHSDVDSKYHRLSSITVVINRVVTLSFVTVPTFIGFLQDVESPYEVSNWSFKYIQEVAVWMYSVSVFQVHDYVRSYLGDTKESKNFASQFLERRSKHKNQLKQQQNTDVCLPSSYVIKKV